MDAGPSPRRQARAQYRYELRTLTYVGLEQANGGVVRDLTQNGIGVQVVAAVCPKQQLELQFELRYPRLRIETRAEVVWAKFSGECGIRFLDMPPALKQQINQWIFGNLLEGVSLHAEHSESIFAEQDTTHLKSYDAANAAAPDGVEEDDGLLVSAAPLKAIELPMRTGLREPDLREELVIADAQPSSSGLDWLTQPLSGRALAWTVDALVVMAALLLFILVFLTVAGEAPKWPLATTAGASVMMAGMYWAFFRTFAGGSLGTKMARIAEEDSGHQPDETRFR